ncbi:MAG: hypothetical protein KY433_11830, partial [Actinobacteria bacterium]|nr:hypothetical protein [Actinomycetota bacterium]
MGAQLLAVGAPLVLLGVLAAWLAGLRERLLSLAVAVPTAVGLLVVTSQLLGSIGLALPLAVVAVLSLLPPLVWGLATPRLARSKPDAVDATLVAPPLAPWPVWTGALLGAALGVVVWLPGIANPDLPGQN